MQQFNNICTTCSNSVHSKRRYSDHPFVDLSPVPSIEALRQALEVPTDIIRVLLKILVNVLENPSNVRYRTIPLAASVSRTFVLNAPVLLRLLHWVGFAPTIGTASGACLHMESLTSVLLSRLKHSAHEVAGFVQGRIDSARAAAGDQVALEDFGRASASSLRSAFETMVPAVSSDISGPAALQAMCAMFDRLSSMVAERASAYGVATLSELSTGYSTHANDFNAWIVGLPDNMQAASIVGAAAKTLRSPTSLRLLYDLQSVIASSAASSAPSSQLSVPGTLYQRVAVLASCDPGLLALMGISVVDPNPAGVSLAGATSLPDPSATKHKHEVHHVPAASSGDVMVFIPNSAARAASEALSRGVLVWTPLWPLRTLSAPVGRNGDGSSSGAGPAIANFSSGSTEIDLAFAATPLELLRITVLVLAAEFASKQASLTLFRDCRDTLVDARVTPSVDEVVTIEPLSDARREAIAAASLKREAALTAEQLVGDIEALMYFEAQLRGSMTINATFKKEAAAYLAKWRETGDFESLYRLRHDWQAKVNRAKADTGRTILDVVPVSRVAMETMSEDVEKVGVE